MNFWSRIKSWAARKPPPDPIKATVQPEVITALTVLDLQPKAWARLNPDGTLDMIDWDAAERLAELHRAKLRQDDIAAVACLVVAVRDHVLSVQVPAIKAKG